MTRGLRNNNPLNIRHGKSRWKGMREEQTDCAFVQFKTRVMGYRAAFVLLRNYIADGTNTISRIIGRWAPSTENNTTAYIAHVSETTGIPDYETVRFEDKETMIGIVRSMAQIESGIIEKIEVLEEAYENLRY